MCTYCSGINGLMISAVQFAWKGKPFDDVEILTGKSMQPTPGKKKTILMGKCIYQAHKDNPVIREAIPIKGCPPKPEDMLKALHQAGIEADPKMFENIDHLPGFYMSRYQDRSEFDEGFFQIE
jgi:coenzyme F420-reducing hydrogenase gamma subunit